MYELATPRQADACCSGLHLSGQMPLGAPVEVSGARRYCGLGMRTMRLGRHCRRAPAPFAWIRRLLVLEWHDAPVIIGLFQLCFPRCPPIRSTWKQQSSSSGLNGSNYRNRRSLGGAELAHSCRRSRNIPAAPGSHGSNDRGETRPECSFGNRRFSEEAVMASPRASRKEHSWRPPLRVTTRIDATQK